jgi:hypothetical protein
MPLRSVLPVAAVALAIGTISGCSSFGPAELASQSSSSPSSSSAQVRPAQAAAMSECDSLMQRVENGFPTAKGYRVPHMREDYREAQELCNSGQPEAGIPILRQILGYMNEEP